MQGLTVDDIDDPVQLKKLVLSLKRQGNLEESRRALDKAKAFEARKEETETKVQTSAQASRAAEAEAIKAPPPQIQEKKEWIKPPPQPPPPPFAEVMRRKKEKEQALSAATVEFEAAPREQGQEDESGGERSGEEEVEEEVEEEDDEDIMAEYQAMIGDDSDGREQEEDIRDDDADYELDEEDMLDIDTLKDLLQIGENLPDKRIYDEKALFYKKEALKFKKAGDIERAKSKLKKAKEFEAAGVEVEKLSEEKNKSADDLLRVMGDDVELEGNDMEEPEWTEEDLKDPDLLLEMAAIGLKTPSVDDILAKAKAKKTEALGFKKSGDIENAKKVLKEAKALEAQAKNLRESLGRGCQGSEDVDFDDLLSGKVDIDDVDPPSERRKKWQSPTSEQSAGEGNAQFLGKTPSSAFESELGTKIASKTPVLVKKFAAEWKEEAITLKKANQLKEAANAFRMYKSALAKEEKVKEKEMLDALVAILGEEIDIAQDQVRLWAFYIKFGLEKEEAKKTCIGWARYSAKCRHTRSAAVAKEEGVIKKLERSEEEDAFLPRIVNGLKFVETDVDALDDRMEICVLSAQKLDENAEFRKAKPQGIHSLRCMVTLGLPPSESNTEGNIQFQTNESKQSETSVDFSFSKFLNVPRGESRYARMILRRLSRKRIEISLCMQLRKTAQQAEASSSGGLFGFRRAPEAPTETHVVLGKVSIELKPLLETNHIVGDFPLMDSKSARRPAGGALRLGLRSGRPFSADATPPEESTSAISGAETIPHALFILH